jgi:hypothetical protein
LEVFNRPPGLAIVENTTVMGSPIYALVTEIDRSNVSDDTFIVPADYEIFTVKNPLKFTKKLNKAAKNKKTYTVGGEIPDVFWDF